MCHFCEVIFYLSILFSAEFGTRHLKGGRSSPSPISRNSKSKTQNQRSKPCLLKKANPKLSLTAGTEKNGRGKAPLTIPSVMQACKSCLLLQGAKNFLQRAQKLFVLFPLHQHPILFSNHVWWNS